MRESNAATVAGVTLLMGAILGFVLGMVMGQNNVLTTAQPELRVEPYVWKVVDPTTNQEEVIGYHR